MVVGQHEPRLLIVPGLNDSGAARWQSWLQAQHRGARRVEQRDGSRPELDRWAERIASTLDREADDAAWIAVAHSFGCLALARHLLLRPDSPVRAALFVAPAEPDKFGVAESLPRLRLPVTSARLAREQRPQRAEFAEGSFAV